MAGKKDKKSKKKKKSLSHIGTALFPRAIFAAVPRSPEPPQHARAPTPTLNRPTSALSSAIMDATMIGQAVGSPSPNNTLRTTGNRSSPRREELADPQRNLENSSMARSSMYDYDDSDDDEEDEDEDDLDYMGVNRKLQQQLAYQDDPGYANLEEVSEMLAEGKRGTISNRARLNSPDMSEGEELESPEPTHRTGTTTNRSEPVPEDTYEMPSTSQPQSHPQGHTLDHPQGHSPDGPDEIDGGGKSGKKKKKKKGKEKGAGKKQKKEDQRVEDLYSQPKKKAPVPERRSSIQSNDSDLTGVTSPTADDFSDLISPTPPWKRKAKSPDIGNPEILSGRKEKKSSKKKAKQLINEPAISRTKADNNQFAAPQKYPDHELYSHLNHSQGLSQSFNDDYLQRTNTRLETELRLIEQERDELLGSLDQRTRQLAEEKSRSYDLRQQATMDSKSKRTDLNKSLGRITDLEAQVDDLSSTCQRQRDEKRSLQEASKRLQAENLTLREEADSNVQDDGMYLSQLKKQAEAVIQENEELKNVIHKLNTQLSRYQAKYDPPQKGDPPGLPTRGSTPRWLTDTRYLSPLILAYDTQLREKERTMEASLEGLEELRRGAEEVIRENQRLHRKLEETGGGGGGLGGGGRLGARNSDSWLSEMEEQARLVLEENQVVLEQMDLQQKKLHEAQRKHAQETIRLTKRIALLESEKNGAESDLSELEMKYGALRDQHERSIRERESQMPVQEHLNTIADYKRSIQELKRKAETDSENTLSKLSAVEAEKTSVAIQVADIQAENSRLRGEIYALRKAQKKLQLKVTMVERELSHSKAREAAANQHLNRVLEIAEQTAAERESFKKMAHSQSQEKEKAVNKMMASNIAIGRMEEKLKMYKHRAESRVDDFRDKMRDQDQLHTSRLTQYEREVRHLGHLVKEKQDALDSAMADRQKVEDQLEVVWQSATEDNKRLKAKLARSLGSPISADANARPFGSDSDHKGFHSSESD